MKDRDRALAKMIRITYEMGCLIDAGFCEELRDANSTMWEECYRRWTANGNKDVPMYGLCKWARSQGEIF
jgi:ubiquinone/menaquinone biosynthesis C-methylase UbiE